MVHTITRVTTNRNAYGDYIQTAVEDISCHFREINNTDATTAPEEAQSDALLWLDPTVAVVENDIFQFDGNYYRVERVTKARRLRNPNVVFIKCEMQRHKI